MFCKDQEETPKIKKTPTSNSSSENDRKRERIENYKETRRRELIAKFGPRNDSTIKSPNSSKRKEDLRGGGNKNGSNVNSHSDSYVHSRNSENQVPSSDSRRYISRRDKNKTEIAVSGNNDEIGNNIEPKSPVSYLKEAVLVRETKASRLRAASRSSASDVGSPSPRSQRDALKASDKEKNVTSSSGSSSSNSLSRKEPDKSHKRKSHLNRSHTSEEVHDDIYMPGDSSARRRRAKTTNVITSLVTNHSDEKSVSANEKPSDMKDSPKSSQHSGSPINLYRRSLNQPLKSVINGDKKIAAKKSDDRIERSSPEFNTGVSKIRATSRKPENGTIRKFSSAENSPVKRNSDDFAKRAELLTANTLKMVNRLDEINNKVKNARGGDKGDKNPEISSPLDAVINNDVKILDSKNVSQKVETKKVPSDENAAKSPWNGKNVKTPKKSDVDLFRRKPSILKKKLTTESFSLSAEEHKPKPVSILKRKSLSQDESHSKTHFFNTPVTFSPSVLEKDARTKKQGILKKRRSLDENEVSRRRSFSPDAFKPILKNQRRSSMEELTRRSKSPESIPQSILKRKPSKEEEQEEVFGPGEPQGILKRKTSTGCSNHQHVKISDSVILAAAVAVGEMQINESVRPILKKKSSSEDHSAPEITGSEVPKPILKKKTSLEADENDEKPMKPILKSSRKPSIDESEQRSRNPSLTTSDVEPKPILKRENSRPKLDVSESEVVLRRVKPERTQRPYSSSCIDEELSAILNKRRSLEFQSVNFDLELRRTKSVSLNDRLKGEEPKRPLSVAEKITNLENFLQNEQLERERRNTSPGSPSSLQQTSSPRLSPSKFSPPKSWSTGAVPKFRLGGMVTRQNDGRSSNDSTYSTESASSLRPSPSPINFNSDEEKSPNYHESGLKLIKSSESDSDDVGCNNCRSRSISPSKKSSESVKESKNSAVFNNFSTDSELSPKNVESCSSVDFLSRKISSLNLSEKILDGMDNQETKEVDEEIFMLRRSGSVSAKASLFQEMERKMKAEAEDEKIKKVPKGTNRGINRHREKKTMESNSQRFHSQPISPEEVELAVKNTKKCSEEKTNDGENHEDELSSLSLTDRVRLFNQRIQNESLPSSSAKVLPVRRRGNRFRTQPVTNEEVENAQKQRLSPLAASLVKPPDSDLFGLGILSAKALKEKIYDHANYILRSKSPNQDEKDDKTKPKGILKNLQADDKQSEPKKPSSESDSSDSEVKSIFKSELSESFQHLKNLKESNSGLKSVKESNSGLKGILKQPSFDKKNTSSSEEGSLSEDEVHRSQARSGANLKTNLASILQNVEPVKVDQRKAEENSSSGIKEIKKIIKNEAVARRRQAGINKLRSGSSIVKSQSHSAVSSIFRSNKNGEGFVNGNERTENEVKFKGKEDEKEKKDEEEENRVPLGGLRRSTTQPFTSSERQADDGMSGASIRERLARLKKSGENDWQKRKTLFTNLEEEFSIITTGNYLFNETCVLKNQVRPISPQPCNTKEEDASSRGSPSILADRLGKLDAAKEGWKKRVQPTDALRFSVEGKMLGKSEAVSPTSLNLRISPTRSPLLERKKKTPKAVRFRSKQCNLALNSTPSSPMERINNPISRSKSAPGSGEDGLFKIFDEEINGPVVTVPRADDETFTSFFDEIDYDKIIHERLEINDEDLDVVTRMKSSQLLVQRKDIKTQRRRATVKNPLKALAARVSLQEYTEVKTGIAEKELKRIKIEKASKNSTLAVEALAGLASQEDFTAINLKKATEDRSSPTAPYRDLMLLQIKGRRHVQTRMVEPVASSVNAGDCFVLVTPSKIFHYIGEYANVIEKSRGAEISLHIQQKPDLGCSASSVVTIGEGGRATREQIKEFWSLLGANENHRVAKAGHPDEDELFESALIDTNMVYEVVDDELVPNETYWGSVPKIEILDPNKVLVFDFGSEFYVWNGKNVKVPDRKTAMKLAKELWEEGYDYGECDVSPLMPASQFEKSRRDENADDVSMKTGPVRPTWALFAKITQNMETVLFREKFLDWPDYSRVIRKSKKDEENEQFDGNASIDVKPCDAKGMLENVVPDADLTLEGSHLGRGIRYYDEETRRCSEVSTHDITVWHINEYEYSELPVSSVGQFHMEDSYVVRWHYMVTITGRELSGLPSKHLTTGRDRYAYFCWQGQDSPINDKGAAACLTVELDREHGPQVRVVQGFENPAFLNLFEGAMVVHDGRRDNDKKALSRWRLFVCRGETESEAVLFEVPCSMRQLRSAASFVLVNRITGLIIIWHGWKSLEHTRKIALSSAKQIRKNRPLEFGFETNDVKTREEIEGTESRDFLKAVGGDNRQLYFSLLDNSRLELKTPRLFHLSSISGEFSATEIAAPYVRKETVVPFPFLQSDLYSASQPALFLLDTGSYLWLWQGWYEGESGEGDRGSSSVRFQAERRAAMSTALSYWDLKYGNTTPKAYLVWAGLEPLEFTNLFPVWVDRDDIAEISIKDGRKPGEMIPVKAELATLTQSTYPLAQLLNRPLPNGVNPTTLEDYLEPQCFPELFGMTKDDFLKMPVWKKKKLKQDVGLF